MLRSSEIRWVTERRTTDKRETDLFFGWKGRRNFNLNQAENAVREHKLNWVGSTDITASVTALVNLSYACVCLNVTQFVLICHAQTAEIEHGQLQLPSPSHATYFLFVNLISRQNGSLKVLSENEIIWSPPEAFLLEKILPLWNSGGADEKRLFAGAYGSVVLIIKEWERCRNQDTIKPTTKNLGLAQENGAPTCPQRPWITAKNFYGVLNFRILALVTYAD